MKTFLNLGVAALIATTAMATQASAKKMKRHNAQGMNTSQGMTTGQGRGYTGGNAAMQGNNGNSGQGSNSLGNIKGGNIGAGK